MRDQQRAHMLCTHSSHRGIVLAARLGRHMHAVGLSCIRLRLRLRLCSAALLALRARPGSGSSAAARRPWLRLWACASARSSALCFGSSPAVIMHAPAAATRAASTASRAMPTIDTRSSTSTCGSYGHDARAAQNPTVELRRDAGHKVRAWTLRRAACALCDRDAGGTRSTDQAARSSRRRCARTSRGAARRATSGILVLLGLRGGGRLRARCALREADGRERRAPRQALMAGQ